MENIEFVNSQIVQLIQSAQYSEALTQIDKQLKSLQKVDSSLLYVPYMNKALVLLRLNRQSEAQTVLNKAQQISKADLKPHYLARVFYYQAIASTSLHDQILYYTRAFNLYQHFDQNLATICQLSIAGVKARQNKIIEAIEIFNSNLNSAHSEQCRFKLGVLNLMRNRFKEAKRHLSSVSGTHQNKANQLIKQYCGAEETEDCGAEGQEGDEDFQRYMREEMQRYLEM
ncbi:Tetratricopeptide-like_helical domain superfamily [Hexamita inflata]|uniref:Tetratricopeptide-like helical domain superfamily n=1 Tax=Hexamita inflata TaxID=28002 RepID=A0AA86N5K4_9EUKA|nr:Tetratricopeptide-like helical domain superfamily [Hexamita inflata]